MADGTDWDIAAQVKPQTSADIISPLAAFTNSQLAAARAQEVGLQVRQSNAAFGARQNYLSMINAGEPPESAIVKSGLSAIDPTSADQALKNVQQGREIGAVRNYDPNNPASLAAGGPELVGKGATALSTQATTQKTQVETQGDKMQLAGQLGTGFLANPTVDSWNSSIQKARQVGLISDLDVQKYWGKPDVGIARSWAAAGAQSVTASGIAEQNQGAAKAGFLTEKVSPGEAVYMAPAAAAAAANGGVARPAMPGVPPQGAAPGSAAAPVVPQAYQSASAVADGFSPAGLARTAQIESGGNPNAFNAGSKAAGLMQFVPSTWKQYGGGASPFDPQAAAEGAQRLAADNKRVLTTQLGRAPTDAELYLAHQQGAGGASALLANPNAKAADIVGMSAVISNGGAPNMTAQQFANLWINKFNKGGGAPGNFGLSGPQSGGPGVAMPPGVNQPPAQIAPMSAAALAAAPAPPAPGGAPGQLAPPPQPAPVSRETPPVVPPPVAPAPAVQAAAAPGATAPATGLPADRAASPLMAVVPGATLEQKNLQEGLGTQDAEQVKTAREAFQDAQIGQQNLQQLSSDLSKLPESSGGLLAPGTGATARLGLAKEINTALTSFGIAPAFDPDKVSAAEAAQKVTGRLGFDLSRTLGSREAASIVHQAITLNPGIENTPQGARIVSASINAALQRSKDFYAFQQQFMAQNGTPRGAEIAFDQARPVGQYVKDVQNLTRVPQKAVDYLQSHAGDPATVAFFDKTYGPGLARYYSATGTQ